MKTAFKLLDNKPVWEIVTTENRSEVFRFVTVNERFIRDAKASGDHKFISDMEDIIKKSDTKLQSCGVWKV